MAGRCAQNARRIGRRELTTAAFANAASVGWTITAREFLVRITYILYNYTFCQGGSLSNACPLQPSVSRNHVNVIFCRWINNCVGEWNQKYFIQVGVSTFVIQIVLFVTQYSTAAFYALVSPPLSSLDSFSCTWV